MTVIELLRKERVLIDLKVNDVKSLMRRLAELMLPEASREEMRDLYQALLDREQLGSTALTLTGSTLGVAIPHGRVKSLREPLACCVRLAKPMALRNGDVEVDLVFAFVTPSVIVEPQLHLLAQIAAVIDDAKLVTRLRAAKNSLALFTELNTWFLTAQFPDVG